MNCRTVVGAFCATTVFICEVARSACLSDDTVLAVWFPARFQYTEGVSLGLCPESSVDLITAAAHKQDLLLQYEEDIVLDDYSPTELPVMLSYRSAKTQCFVTHGVNGGFGAEFYSSEATRNSVLNGYNYTGIGTANFVYLNENGLPVTAYGIFVTSNGIKSNFEPGLDPWAMIFAGYCYSAVGADSWATQHGLLGRTFIGYPEVCSTVSGACADLEMIMKHMGCLDDGDGVPESGHVVGLLDEQHPSSEWILHY